MYCDNRNIGKYHKFQHFNIPASQNFDILKVPNLKTANFSKFVLNE